MLWKWKLEKFTVQKYWKWTVQQWHVNSMEIWHYNLNTRELNQIGLDQMNLFTNISTKAENECDAWNNNFFYHFLLKRKNIQIRECIKWNGYLVTHYNTIIINTYKLFFIFRFDSFSSSFMLCKKVNPIKLNQKLNDSIKMNERFVV